MDNLSEKEYTNGITVRELIEALERVESKDAEVIMDVNMRDYQIHGLMAENFGSKGEPSYRVYLTNLLKIKW